MEFAIIAAVHADIDDIGVRLIGIGAVEEIEPASRTDDEIGMRQIETFIFFACFAMKLDNVAVMGQKQFRHRFSNYIGTPDHDRVLPLELEPFVFEVFDDSFRRARDEFRQGMESIHILGGINGQFDFSFIDVPRKGKLDNQAIHVLVFVVLFYSRKKFFFRGCLRKLIQPDIKPELCSIFQFSANISIARGIIVHLNDDQTRLSFQAFYQSADFFFPLDNKISDFHTGKSNIGFFFVKRKTKKDICERKKALGLSTVFGDYEARIDSSNAKKR